MRGAIPPLPQYAFMASYLVKHRDNFTFFTFYPAMTLSSESLWYYETHFQPLRQIAVREVETTLEV
jgi:hypothetical protein